MSKLNPPKKGNEDKAGDLMQAVFNCIVPGGPIISQLILSKFQTPYQKRIDEWQIDVTETLNKIEADGISLDQLKNNDKFLDILLQSYPIWIKNHQQEKREALKNAVYHSAQDSAPDLSIQQLFLHCIDAFTVWHLKLLYLFKSPPINGSQEIKKLHEQNLRFNSIRSVLEKEFQELRGKKEFVNLIWSDLFSKSFVKSDCSILDVTMTGNGTFEKRTTELGEQFLSYIYDDQEKNS